MNHLKLFVVSLLISLVISPAVFAATVDINWVEPDKFQDIESAESRQERFQERVFKSLGNTIETLAARLPDTYHMNISVTDIDLAGDVKFTHTERIRIVDDLYFPSIKLNYELLDKEHKSLAASDVRVKDMGFLQGIHHSARHRDFLHYEGIMLQDWFKKTFAEYLVQK